MNISKRHHYIPEFFIKGFVGDDGKLAVYNRKKKRVERLRMSPKQVFFEWNRNTFNVNNETTDFVEKLFKKVEDHFAPVYKKMTEHFEQYELAPYDMLHVIHYIGILHTSLPINDERIESCIKNSSKEDLFMSITNSKTGKSDKNADKIFERFKENSAFIQSAKFFKATVDYLKNKNSRNIKNWKTYYSTGDAQHHLIGDNPIILRNENVDSIYDTELIFPLTKGITVFHSKGKDLEEVSAKDRIFIDVLTILQSDKIVCGPNTEYLKKIVDIAEKYPTQKLIKYTKEKTFEIFD